MESDTRCAAEQPLLRRLESGAQVACHFAETIPAPPPIPLSPENPAIARRFAALAGARV